MEEVTTSAWLEGEIATGNARAIVISLCSGDILVISYEGRIPVKERVRIQEFLQEMLPDHRIAVMDGGPWFTAIHPEA